MTATSALTAGLQRQVQLLEDDLRGRLAVDLEREGRWKQEHQRALDKERTAASWVTWRDDRITQAAVAWVLTCVFVRFCEDNGLVRPVWITGPGGRRQEALDAQLAFFREHPEDTDREWLLDAVSYLARLPATRALVDDHSALHLVSPSGDAATKLLEFWRRRGEDGPLLLTMLEEGRYDAVVGNPPYITVKDKALNRIYRSKYADVCKGTYALTVPFMKLFFALAKRGERPGWVGQITSNSFMKREFGTKLIEDFLAHQDLRLVADTSGAYIPGHGTPTVIIAGRNQSPVCSTVRAVLGVRGEPGRLDNPAKGLVWTSIVEHVGSPSWDDGWITVTDLDGSLLATHPWSLSGGGAVELAAAVEAAGRRDAADVIAGKIGFASFPGADDVFFASRSALRRCNVPGRLARAVITGDIVRDWAVGEGEGALTPYDAQAILVPLDERGWGRRLWPFRLSPAFRNRPLIHA